MSDIEMAKSISDLQRRVAELERREKPRLNRGTGNPSGWLTGLPFYRSDLGMWIFYDGTQWLTEQILSRSLNLTSNTNIGFISIGGEISTLNAILISLVPVGSRVSAINNASNYWNISIGVSNYSTTNQDIYQFNTASDGTEWVHRNGNPLITPPLSYARFFIWGTKTGTPGAIDIAVSPNYRLVIP